MVCLVLKYYHILTCLFAVSGDHSKCNAELTRRAKERKAPNKPITSKEMQAPTKQLTSEPLPKKRNRGPIQTIVPVVSSASVSGNAKEKKTGGPPITEVRICKSVAVFSMI